MPDPDFVLPSDESSDEECDACEEGSVMASEESTVASEESTVSSYADNETFNEPDVTDAMEVLTEWFLPGVGGVLFVYDECLTPEKNALRIIKAVAGVKRSRSRQ